MAERRSSHTCREAGDLSGDGRIGRTLGLTSTETAFVLDRARSRLGARGFWLRRVAFGIAVSRAGQAVLPRPLRRRLIGALLAHTLAGTEDAVAYVGLRPLEPSAEPPRGLLPGSP